MQILLNILCFIERLLGITFNLFYQVDYEGRPLLQHALPLCTCIFYLMMVERTTIHVVENND